MAMKALTRGVGVILVGGCWLLAGTGCLSVPIPQAEADPARFYVLSTTTPTVANDGAASAPAIQLQPVDVASYLRSRPMIVRRGENEIQFREFARWGESLDVGVARVLREELLARGAASSVHIGARAIGAGNSFTLTIRVLACEGGADGSVYFRAVWDLAAGAGEGAHVARGDFRPAGLRWDGKTEGSLAAQLSVAVAGLAGEIAAALPKR